MAITPISFRGIDDDIDLLPCVDARYKHLYQRKNYDEYATPSYTSPRSTKDVSDTFQRSDSRSCKRSSGNHQKGNNNPTGITNAQLKRAIALASALLVSVGVAVNANCKSEADAISDSEVSVSDVYTGREEEGSDIYGVPYDYDTGITDSESAQTSKTTPEPTPEVTPEVTEEPTFEDKFGFSMNLSEEQEYSLEKFVENWEENKSRYEDVEKKTGKPAELVAALHWREAGGDFDKCLQDGTDLGKPVQAPASKDKVFYTFEDSAEDVLNIDYFKNIEVTEGDFDSYLYFAEAYNGFGYRNKGLPSPYIWAGTNNYTSGKYAEDGKLDTDYVDKQPGVAVLLSSIL